MGLTRVSESMTMRQAREGLTNYLYPSTDGGWRDIYRSGWQPSWFNQQWGGAQWGTEMQDAATGQTYKFDVATGNVQDDTIYNIGGIAAQYYGAQGFKVAESFTVDSVWLKLFKVQGTVSTNYNLTVRIYSDSAGLPNAALGTASTISMKQITSKTDGEWYRISGLNCALVASTQYHIVVTTSNTDASNYVVWKETASRKYPFGNVSTSISTPTWAAAAGYAMCFLIEPPATAQYLQTSGKFDKKLTFNESALLNQSKSLSQPLKNFFDGQQFTYLVRGTGFAKNKPVADFVYGLDHDRIVLIPDATTGFGVLKLYDKTGVVYTVTGTTDLSTAAFKDITISVRAKGDGADYLQLWVNGTKEAEVSAQSFSFDSLFRDLGTAWLGGGFPVAPTWTTGSISSFSMLPSSSGWTWTGTATEANAMSVANGKLYQNKTGYASTDTGYYAKSSAGLSNATGWTISWKTRITQGTNLVGLCPSIMQIEDGTKIVSVGVHEGFIQVYGSGLDFIVQGDFRSQENVFTIFGKGSDYYLFVNNKLVVDGTGKLINTSVNNKISYGDMASGAGENGDAIWSYVKYYTGGTLIPQASTGASVSETVFWSGDKTAALRDLYNAGTPVSAKTYMGFERNYVGEGVVQRDIRGGLAYTSTTSTAKVLMSEMELYAIGSYLALDSNTTVLSGSIQTNTALFIDGGNVSEMAASSVASVSQNNDTRRFVPLGLHKIELRYNVTTGTATITSRTLLVEARS